MQCTIKPSPPNRRDQQRWWTKPPASLAKVGWRPKLALLLLCYISHIVPCQANVEATTSAAAYQSLPAEPLWMQANLPPTLQIEQSAMLQLLGWSALNLVGGGLAGIWTTGWLQSFFLTNAGWNVINAALAGSALLSTPPPTMTEQQLQQRGEHWLRVLLLNAGLDVAYMTAGGFLLERGLNRQQNLFVGIGASLLLQGGFLLLFDSLQAYRMGRQLDEQQQPIAAGPPPIGM